MYKSTEPKTNYEQRLFRYSRPRKIGWLDSRNCRFWLGSVLWLVFICKFNGNHRAWLSHVNGANFLRYSNWIEIIGGISFYPSSSILSPSARHIIHHGSAVRIYWQMENHNQLLESSGSWNQKTRLCMIKLAMHDNGWVRLDGCFWTCSKSLLIPRIETLAFSGITLNTIFQITLRV